MGKTPCVRYWGVPNVPSAFLVTDRSHHPLSQPLAKSLGPAFHALATEPLTGVVIVTEDGTILYSNTQMARMLSGPTAKAEDATGKHIGELYASKFALERLENIRSVLDKSSPLMIRHIWQGYQVYSWVIPLTLDDDTAEALDSKRATQRRVLVISRRVGTEDKPFDLVAGPIEKIDAEVIQLGPLDVLSPRELEVLALLGQGLSAAEIAAVLNRSVKTINTHRENIGKKLKIDDRVKLAMVAQRAGLQLADAEKERV
jgi:DNA-binding CsgD family transcriptional regulator